MKPTVTGWYWYRSAYMSMRTNAVTLGSPMIVNVLMSATLRSRVVPQMFSIGGFNMRLDKVHSAAEFVGPLECPWKESK